MKTKTILIFFLLLLVLISAGLSGGLYLFNREKNDALKDALRLQQKNSLELITEQVYGDLLIDNTMEVERKLNVMVEKKVIESFSLMKGEDQKDSSAFCQVIYFDKINKQGVWGNFCVKFSSEHLGVNTLDLKGLTTAVIFLSAFFLMIIVLIFRQVTKQSQKLHKGVESALLHPDKDIIGSDLWAPVLGHLRQEVSRSKKAEEELLKRQIEEEKILIAHQVSHDIRSPLSVLRMALDEVSGVALEQRLMIENAIQRINDISDNLLQSFKKKVPKNELDEMALAPVLDQLVAEKKLQYKGREDITFSYHFPLELKEAKIKIHRSDFQRLFSNIVNNAVEAMSSGGVIDIKVSKHFPLIVISITDQGAGIPKEILGKIGERGLTHGKDGSASGSGLGLSHAKEAMKSFAGQLVIESKEGKGTTINLSLPAAFGHEEDATSFFDYVFIDNDKIMRLAWEQRARKNKVKLLSLSTLAEFDEYLQQIDKEKTCIYIDSDLGEEQIPGEEFALKLHKAGYQKLFMASSHEMPEFYPWLRNSGKTCPF
nr:HAMP domain-containing histidine kinase [Bacteriovorax sp. HI3]